MVAPAQHFDGAKFFNLHNFSGDLWQLFFESFRMQEMHIPIISIVTPPTSNQMAYSEQLL